MSVFDNYLEHVAPMDCTLEFDTHNVRYKVNANLPSHIEDDEMPNNNEGLKYDADKPPIDLVDAEYIEGLARVLGFGANKYSRHNWRNGIVYSRLIAAAYRHLGAINKGEDLDNESGLPHVYHLACCTQFLASMMTHRPDLDDRWKPSVKATNE